MTEPYRHDPEALSKVLVFTQEDQVLVNVPVTVHIPERFEVKNLAILGEETFVLGCFATVLDDGRYAVTLANALIPIAPDTIERGKIDDVPYLFLRVEAGQTMIPNINLVKRDRLVFTVLEELVFNGNRPWYLDYATSGELFDTSQEFANSGFGEDPELIELMMSLTARDPDQPERYYRTSLDRMDDLKRPPLIVPLNEVSYTASSTLAKLAGSYFKEGLTSALVSPSNAVGRVEKMLRA